MREQFITYIKASFPIIQVLSSETERAKKIINQAVREVNSMLVNSKADDWLKETGFQLATWDCVRGIRMNGNSQPVSGTTDPESALRYVLEEVNSPIILIMENFGVWLNGPVGPILCQYLIEIYRNMYLRKHVVIIGNDPLPQVLRSYAVVVDLPLPNKKEIEALVRQFSSEVLDIEEPEKTLPMDLIVNTCIGMDSLQVHSSLCVAVVESTKGFDHQVLYKEKAKAVRKSGLLELIEVEPIEHIGGLENLKSWFKMIAKVYKNPTKAEKYKLPPLKGTLVIGVPGTGKTLCAKAVASLFEVPLVRFDVGRLMGSFVGETERNTREAFQLIEALDRCVVLIDELEKALAGASSATDSGVTARFVGSLLYFMQEKKGNSFFVCTANNVKSLPPELTRKGRFDEMWYVGLPSTEDIVNILKIHLKKVGRNPDKFGVELIARHMAGFTGAEVENCVKFALYKAFFAKREVTAQDIIECAKEITPFSKTYKEEIDALESWAQTRARFASQRIEIEPKRTKKRILN